MGTAPPKNIFPNAEQSLRAYGTATMAHFHLHSQGLWARTQVLWLGWEVRLLWGHCRGEEVVTTKNAPVTTSWLGHSQAAPPTNPC